jgi:acetyl-CoA synthetase
VPGIDAGLVDRDTDDRVRVLNASDVDGEVAIRAGWPSMFRGYLDGPAGTGIVDGWYLIGETARRDADGCFWFTASSTVDEAPFPGAGAAETGTGQTIAYESGVRR